MSPLSNAIALLLVALLIQRTISSRILAGNATRIHTMNVSEPLAEAICIDEGVILAIGKLEDVFKICGPTAETLDLALATIFPGFVDSHLHLMYGGMNLLFPQLAGASSVAEVIERLQDFVRDHPLEPGEWIVGFGWDQNEFMPNGSFPTRWDLDAAFPETPLWLTRIDGHSCWANSKALENVSLPEEDPVGGQIVRTKEGVPTGIFVDSARQYIEQHVPPPSEAQHAEGLELALRECASVGLTGVHDPGIDPNTIRTIKRSIDADTFTLRHYAMWLGIGGSDLGEAVPPSTPKLRYGDGLLRVEAVKFFLDGALGSWGAAMLEPYSDHPELSGTLRMDAQDFASNVTAWVANGYQVATHAIGDRANRLVLDVYESLCARQLEQRRGGTAVDAVVDLRLRIEHFQIAAPQDIERLHADQGCIIASMQPTHATSDMAFAEDRLGSARLRGAYALKSVDEAGPHALTLGSDWPTAGIYAAVTRQDVSGNPVGGWTPTEKISRLEAVRGYTTRPAYASFSEATQGMLAPGFVADFVALDRDILDEFEVPDPDLINVTVLGTWLAGKRVFKHECWEVVERDACTQATRAAMSPRPRAVGDGCPH